MRLKEVLTEENPEGPWERAGGLQAVAHNSQQAAEDSSNMRNDNYLLKCLLGYACDKRVSFNPHNKPMRQ